VNIEDDEVLANFWIAIVQKADSPLSPDDLDAASQGSSTEECVALARPVTNEADHPRAQAIEIFDQVPGNVHTAFDS
jgi:hypothetical protein